MLWISYIRNFYRLFHYFYNNRFVFYTYWWSSSFYGVDTVIKYGYLGEIILNQITKLRIDFINASKMRIRIFPLKFLTCLWILYELSISTIYSSLYIQLLFGSRQDGPKSDGFITCRRKTDLSIGLFAL